MVGFQVGRKTLRLILPNKQNPKIKGKKKRGIFSTSFIFMGKVRLFDSLFLANQFRWCLHSYQVGKEPVQFSWTSIFLWKLWKQFRVICFRSLCFSSFQRMINYFFDSCIVTSLAFQSSIMTAT